MSVPSPPLLAPFRALDIVLAAAVERIHAARADGHVDPFKGLHVERADVLDDLARHPGAPMYGIGCDAIRAVIDVEPQLAALCNAYALTPFEASCLLLAMAPEVDARYERLYGYLQDDVTKKRPSAALALDLFAADLEDRLRCRRMLMPGATLFRERLLDAPMATGASQLGSPLAVNTQLIRYLLDAPGLDPALQTWCTLIARAPVVMPAWLPAADIARLDRVADEVAAGRVPFVLHFRGAHGTDKYRTARALTARAGKGLLVADLRGALRSPEGFVWSLRRVVREAVLQRAVLYLRGHDALVDAGERQALRTLAETLAAPATLTIVSGTRAWLDAGVPLDAVEIEFDLEDAGARAASWRAALDDRDLAVDDDAPEALAERFRLRPSQIRAAVAAACARRAWTMTAGGAGSPAGLEELARGARGQSGHALAALARRVAPTRRWSDLVLPLQTLDVLREIGSRVTHRRRVLADWGFDARLSLGKGVTVLLAGPSGTGKTLAAEVLAAELGLDLFRIDLSRIVSKYIGETEQNLDRVFEAARDANAVLLFDEAEALFGKRSEVRDAHDRYANLEVAYLLQKMEEFDGLALLSTNLRQNIDEAFTRRLTFTVHFPFPAADSRTRIWEIVWPAETPRADDVDAAALGREVVLSGGGIKNAALAAAFYAAADGGVVTRAHVLQAVQREFQKMGRVPAPSEAIS